MEVGDGKDKQNLKGEKKSDLDPFNNIKSVTSPDSQVPFFKRKTLYP